jgi:hypothetical protein
VSLTNYITDTSSLLFDYGLNFTPQRQLVRWINESRRQLAQGTGCIRRHLAGQSAFGASAQPGSFIPGGAQPGQLPGAFPNAQFNATTNSFQTIYPVERYPFQGFANSYLKDAYAGCEAILDVAQVAVSWGGSPMPSLVWKPWDDLQAYARAYKNLVTSYPYFWSVLDDGENGEVWIFPVPQQALEMEWDVYAVPSAIYSDNDYDAIPGGLRNAVKFEAASLALMGKQRYADAEYLHSIFERRLLGGVAARDRGKTPNYYYTDI